MSDLANCIREREEIWQENAKLKLEYTALQAQVETLKAELQAEKEWLDEMTPIIGF